MKKCRTEKRHIVVTADIAGERTFLAIEADVRAGTPDDDIEFVKIARSALRKRGRLISIFVRPKPPTKRKRSRHHARTV